MRTVATCWYTFSIHPITASENWCLQTIYTAHKERERVFDHLPSITEWPSACSILRTLFFCAFVGHQSRSVQSINHTYSNISGDFCMSWTTAPFPRKMWSTQKSLIRHSFFFEGRWIFFGWVLSACVRYLSPFCVQSWGVFQTRATT